MSGPSGKRPALPEHSQQLPIPKLAQQINALARDPSLALATLIEIYCHYSKHENGKLPPLSIGVTWLPVTEANFHIKNILADLERVKPIRDAVQAQHGTDYHCIFAEIYRIHGKPCLQSGVRLRTYLLWTGPKVTAQELVPLIGVSKLIKKQLPAYVLASKFYFPRLCTDLEFRVYEMGKQTESAAEEVRLRDLQAGATNQEAGLQYRRLVEWVTSDDFNSNIAIPEGIMTLPDLVILSTSPFTTSPERTDGSQSRLREVLPPVHALFILAMANTVMNHREQLQ